MIGLKKKPLQFPNAIYEETMVMSQQKAKGKDWFTKLFHLWEQGLNGHQNHPMVKYRRQGFLELQNAAFPNRRDEDWKYTNLNRILQIPFQPGRVSEESVNLEPYYIPGLESIKIELSNGILQTDLSTLNLPQGLQIVPVAEALKNQEWVDWITVQIENKGGTSKNAFVPLNQAFGDHGLAIKVDRNTNVDLPVEIVHYTDQANDPIFANPQLFILCERGSSLTVIDSYVSPSNHDTYLQNAGVWFDVHDTAELHHYKLNRESKSAFHIHNMFIQQGRDSNFTSHVLDLGGRIVRNNVSASHKSSGITTNLFGCYLGNDDQHIDNQTFIDHAVAHCQSNELYKGILDDRSRGVFNGKVLVRQDAQKTNAFQQNNSLVLSSKAIMDTKPQLEIFADDVRCSHGATIGQLDENAIFYLRSRGIPKEEAENMLQIGFLSEVIEEMQIEEIQAEVKNWISTKLLR